MVFKGWQKVSLNEWPGKVCSVIFVGGCNFHCPFCYNYELVLYPQKLPDINESEVSDYCQENKDLLDGIMITGGEPLASLKIKNQKSKIKNSLLDFIRKIKDIGLKIGIETNGSNPEAIEYLIKNNLINYIAMDVKAPLNQKKYNRMAGVRVDLIKIKKSIKIIIDSSIEHEFRTTVVPGMLDRNDILKIVKGMRGAKKYYLQQYQSNKTVGKVPNVKPYPRDWFKQTIRKIRELTNVELRI